MIHFLHNAKPVMAFFLSLLVLYQVIESCKKNNGKGILTAVASNLGSLLMVFNILDSNLSHNDHAISDEIEKALPILNVVNQPAELAPKNFWDSPWVTVLAIALTAIL